MPVTDEWWTKARCAEADPGDFTAEYASQGNYKKAREWCKACPVRRECLNDVLGFPPPVVYSEVEGLPGHQRHVVEFPMFQAGLTPRELAELYYLVHPIT